MRHHTSTHLILGATRRVLGQHVWQAGAQKGPETSRIDISHYERLTGDQTREIERLATEVALQDIPVESQWLPREKAEQTYGYRLYQGGVVPGRELRIIKIGDWDVEACGGTHCTATGQVGTIKILRTERIQDGVERIIFTAGTQTLRAFQEQEQKIRTISNTIEAPVDKVDQYVKNMAQENLNLTRRVETLVKEWAQNESGRLLKLAKSIGPVKLCQATYNQVTDDDVILVNNIILQQDKDAVTILLLVGETVRVFVGAGTNAIKHGMNAGQIASKIANLLGGGGGGKEYFGQGGGKTSNVNLVARNAEEIIKSTITR